MSANTPVLLSYRAFVARDRTNPLYQREIPLESYRSLTLPTLRLGEPAFAAFSAPATRRPRTPLEVGSPDRWWASRAAGGRLLVFTRAAILPLPGDELPARVTVSPSPDGPVDPAAARAEIEALETLLDAAAAAFFAGEPGTPELRAGLRAALDGVLPGSLRPYYHALVPDFFAWLHA